VIPNPSTNINQLESNNPTNGEFIIPIYRTHFQLIFSQGGDLVTSWPTLDSPIITAKLRHLGCLGWQPAMDGWSSVFIFKRWSLALTARCLYL
jgi:hypothetical protein